MTHAKRDRFETLLIPLFSCLEFRFCLTTVSIFFDYIENWCSGVAIGMHSWLLP